MKLPGGVTSRIVEDACEHVGEWFYENLPLDSDVDKIFDYVRDQLGFAIEHELESFSIAADDVKKDE